MATNNFSSEVSEWVTKTQKRMNVVTAQATNDVMKQASRTMSGVTRGGTLTKGYVPRDLGTLTNSLVSSLYGSTSITQGEGDFSLVVGSMKAGDVAKFTWTAPYARRMHYGFRGTDSLGRTYNQAGWFWVTEAAAQWQSIVAAAVARAKAQVR